MNISESSTFNGRLYAGFIFMILSAAIASLLILPKPYNFLPFVIVIGAAFLIFSIRYPMIGVVAYMLLFFIRPQELFPDVAVFSFPYERIVAIVVVANLIMEHAFSGKKFRIFQMDKAVAAVLAAALLSIVTSIWITQSWRSFQNLFKIIVVYYFLTHIIDNENKFKWVLWLYVLSIGFIAVSSTINYYSGHVLTAMGIQRAVGIGDEGSAYGDPNTMATTLVLGIPFIYYLGKAYRSRLLRLLMLLLIGLTLWTIILTGSRGGMLGAAVIMLLLAWNSRRKIGATIAVVMLIIMVLAAMPREYFSRLSSIADFNDPNDPSGAAQSAQGRIKGFLVGLEIITKRPLAGVGIGCFGIYNHEYHNSYLNAHNLMGQLMGETGLAGVGAFAFLIYMLIKYIRYIKFQYRKRNWRPDLGYYLAVPIKIALIGLLFLGLFGHNAWRPNWYMYACFLVITVNLVGKRMQAEDDALAEQPVASVEHQTTAISNPAV